MKPKLHRRILIFISTFIIFTLLFSSGHFEYNKKALIGERLSYKHNVAEAATYELVGTYGKSENVGTYSYSVYMDSDYDYEFRIAWLNGNVGNSPHIYVSDIASPYYIKVLNNQNGGVHGWGIHEYALNTSTGIFQPSTSGNYNVSTAEILVNLYRTPRVNPFRQYGDVLTPVPNYPTSATLTTRAVIDTDGDGDDIYGDVTIGVKDINLGTIKYDSLTRTFTATINSFTGIISYHISNYSFTFYIVDSSGKRTQIFYQTRGEIMSFIFNMLGGTRAVTVNNVNCPVRMEVVLNTPSPVTTVIPFQDTLPPTLTLSSSNMSPTSQPVTVNVNATDNAGVSQIKWASGNQPASYFSNAGTVLNGNTFTVNTSGIYTVCAIDTSGNKTVQTINVSNIYILSTPALSISNATSNTMDVNITDSNTLPVEYQLSTSINGQKYYVTSSGTLSTLQQNINLPNKKIKVSGLTPNTTYTFQACAIYNTVTSPLSSTVSGITMLIDPPEIPQNISVDCKASSITISWNTVNGVDGYLVECDGVQKDVGMNLFYIDSNLAVKSTHTYRVAAKRNWTVGNWSPLLTVSTVGDTEAPSIPSNLRMTAQNASSITLVWGQSIDDVGVIGYDIYNNSIKIGSTAGETTYEVTGLIPNKINTFTVVAKDAAGNTSALSNEVKVTISKIEYQYDSNNKLIKILRDGQVLIEFNYDANGNLKGIQKINP